MQNLREKTWAERRGLDDGALAAAGVSKTFHITDTLASTQFELPKGSMIGKHVHAYDHQSILAHGVVQVTCDGYPTVYRAPKLVFIARNKVHEVLALENSTWFCIHAISDAELED